MGAVGAVRAVRAVGAVGAVRAVGTLGAVRAVRAVRAVGAVGAVGLWGLWGSGNSGSCEIGLPEKLYLWGVCKTPLRDKYCCNGLAVTFAVTGMATRGRGCISRCTYITPFYQIKIH